MLQNRLRDRADEDGATVGRLHSCLHQDRRLLPRRVALSGREAHEGQRRWRHQRQVPVRKHDAEGWGIFGPGRRQLSRLHVPTTTDASLHTELLMFKHVNSQSFI